MIDLINKKFGKLRVTSQAPNKIHGGQTKRMFHCVCECGNKVMITYGNLTRKGKKSCGCNHRRHGKSSPGWKGYEGLPGSFYCQIKTNARVRDMRFDVNIKYLWDLFKKQKACCAISGLPIHISTLRRKEIKQQNTASLDRINSKYGYIKSNVQWVHKDVNLMKNHFSENYFIKICKAIYKTNS